MTTTFFSKFWANLYVLQNNLSSDLHFDTTPTKIKNKTKHLSTMKSLRNAHLFVGSVQIGAGGLLILSSTTPLLTSLITTGFVLNNAFNAYRFNNVINGKWQLTDTIPTQEEKETKTNMVPSPSF